MIKNLFVSALAIYLLFFSLVKSEGIRKPFSDNEYYLTPKVLSFPDFSDKGKFQNFTAIKLNGVDVIFPYNRSVKLIENIETRYNIDQLANDDEIIYLLLIDDKKIFLNKNSDYQRCEFCDEIKYSDKVLEKIFNLTPKAISYDDKTASLLLKKISFLPQHSDQIFKLSIDDKNIYLSGSNKYDDIHVIFTFNEKVYKFRFFHSKFNDDFLFFLKSIKFKPQ